MSTKNELVLMRLQHLCVARDAVEKADAAHSELTKITAFMESVANALCALALQYDIDQAEGKDK